MAVDNHWYCWMPSYKEPEGKCWGESESFRCVLEGHSWEWQMGLGTYS